MRPIPLVVASPNAERDAIARLRSALLAFHSQSELVATRDTLLLLRFAIIEADAMLDRIRPD
jgi:hypothetical protein